jgi:hypothetical protein
MKLFSDIRLLLLGIWLGAAVFFIAVAQSAFAVLPQRELAGSVVNSTLAVLNFGGIVISAVLLLTTLFGMSGVRPLWVWAERVLLAILLVTCAVGHFVIGFWLTSVRVQMGVPIDELAADHPLRVQFNMLHEYSVWVLFAGMAAALITFFIVSNRHFGKPEKADDTYDFSKEFKT